MPNGAFRGSHNTPCSSILMINIRKQKRNKPIVLFSKSKCILCGQAYKIILVAENTRVR